MLLNEDGSLDIERINKLGRKEFNEEMKSWGYKQVEEYLAKSPSNESRQSKQDWIIEFDGTLEEFMEKFC